MPTSWLLGFRFSSLSSRESLSFLCGSGACGASGTLSLVPRSFVLCCSLFALSAQPSQAPGWRGEPPPSIWEGGSRGTEGALPLVLLESKNPPGSGWVCSLELGRQVIDDDDIDPVGRSRRSVGHTGGVITSRSGGICNGVRLNLAIRFRNLFRGPASALLHASGSPTEETAASSLLAKCPPI